MTVQCTCGFEIPFHETACPGCQKAAGFPNVRAAEDPAEVAALGLRLDAAKLLAETQSCVLEADEFRAAVKQSVAVIARDLGVLSSLYLAGTAIAPFHAQVRAGSRIPQDNDWDRIRTAAESSVSPLYHEAISYAALSLDGSGAAGWGDFSLTLGDRFIAERSSVLEENVILFFKKHVTAPSHLPPKGYRASWEHRDDLAVAKLQPKIKPGMSAKDFAAILLDQGTGRSDADFIEVHIYGPIHLGIITKVTGRKPAQEEDQHIWRHLSKKLTRQGVAVVEAT